MTEEPNREGKNDMTLSKLLQDGYLKWLNDRGSYATQADFAIELGINPVTFNRHYNGRTTPSQGDPVVEKYAAHFGDLIYDVLGLARQSDQFLAFKDRFDQTPQENREELLAIIDDYLVKIGARKLD